jgi:uncharacterized FlgJ-related protein
MLLSELYDEELIEGPVWNRIKNTAAAGAVAAGIGAGGIGMLSKAPQAPIAQPQQSVSAVQRAADTQPQKQAEPKKQEKAAVTNPNFPKELQNQDKVDRDTRVENFTKAVLPFINAENQRIMHDRARIMRDAIALKRGVKLPVDENDFLNAMFDQYGASNVMELLDKVDIIPPSIALAQAAIESSWGQDEKSKAANVFYGQKSFGKADSVEGPYGEKYHAFQTPQGSVNSYMLNLNTHRAYAAFRKHRAELRKHNKPVEGLALVPNLINYTDTGGEYPKKLKSIIVSNDFDQYDPKSKK